MSGATGPERRPDPTRVTSGAALLLLVAGLVTAALVALGVGGLTEGADAGLGGVRTAQGAVAVPPAPAPAPGLAAGGAVVAFDVRADALPPAPTGPFREEGGEWRVEADGAAVTPDGRSSPTAVVVAAADATVQVTLAEARPGAGVITSWSGPDCYVALVVDPSGRNLVLLRIAGESRPDVLLTAPLSAPAGSVVMALRRDGSRVEAVANGAALGSRVVTRVREGTSVGMVAGLGRSGQETRFTELVVG